MALSVRLDQQELRVPSALLVLGGGVRGRSAGAAAEQAPRPNEEATARPRTAAPAARFANEATGARCRGTGDRFMPATLSRYGGAVKSLSRSVGFEAPA